MILHRRAGKTTTTLNHHCKYAILDDAEAQRLLYLQPSLKDAGLNELIKPPGGRHYGHIMPLRSQAKAVAWDKLKYYMQPVGGTANEAELLYRMPNGNKVQLFGADNPDAFRGMAFSGLSFDEYSQQPRNIFSESLSKALAEHLGYAIFEGTIKGKDHLYDTHVAAKANPDQWFQLWQDLDVSLATEDGITVQMLRQALADDMRFVEQGLMTEEELQQEWYLSLEAAIKGAYYAKELAKVRKAGQIRAVPYDPEWPVSTAWDLGYDDDSAIWFYQNIANEIHVIDYHCESGGTIEVFEGGAHRPGTLTQQILNRPYAYGTHWLPHDARAKTLAANGKSVVEQLGKYLGMQKLAIVPTLSVQDGIQAVRSVLGRCWFDEIKCEPGLNALLHYRRKHDTVSDSLAPKPVHDWASHPADGFRMLAVAERKPEIDTPPAKGKNITEVTLDELWQWQEELTMQEERI